MPLPVIWTGAAMSQWRKAERNLEKGRAMAKESGRISPGEFLRQVRSETSKVVWPTRQETIRMSILVGILTLILSLFFLGVDSLFGAVVRWLLALT